MHQKKKISSLEWYRVYHLFNTLTPLLIQMTEYSRSTTLDGSPSHCDQQQTTKNVVSLEERPASLWLEELEIVVEKDVHGRLGVVDKP